MKKALKIAVIGGGSSYTPELMEGFIQRYNQLPLKEIWLVDIESGLEKLNIVGELAKRMVKAAGIDCTVHLSLNRSEALKNADFVLTQLRVGQLDARILDERIPLAKGLLGQETNGVGGFGKALRTIPVILDIAREMEALCPEAWLINFANPAGIVTEAVLNHTSIKAIGLCNVPVNMKKAVESVLGHTDFTFHALGLNHYVWGKHVYVKGKDIMPELLPRLLEDDSFNPKNIGDTPYLSEHIMAMGLMPCYYHAYYYVEESMLKKAIKDYENNGTRAETVKAVEAELFEVYHDIHLKEKPKMLEQRGGAYYSEAACNLVCSIYNDARDLMVVNVKNNGTVASLPDHAVIESTCVVTSSGAFPLKSSPLPFWANAELMILKAYEEKTIEAAISGDYQTALHALSLHPLTTTGESLKAILKELLIAHEPYLPLFKEAIDQLKA